MKPEARPLFAEQIETAKKAFAIFTAAVTCGAPFANQDFLAEKSREGDPMLFGKIPEQQVDISKTDYIKTADSLSDAQLASLRMTRERYHEVRPHLRGFFYDSGEGVDPKYAPHQGPVPVFSSTLVRSLYYFDHQQSKAKHAYLSDGEIDGVLRSSLIALGKEVLIPTEEARDASDANQHYTFSKRSSRPNIGGAAGVRLVPYTSPSFGSYYMNEANVTFVNYAKDLMLSKNIVFASPEDEDAWKSMPETARIDAYKQMFEKYYAIMVGHEKVHGDGMLSHEAGTLMHSKVIFTISIHKGDDSPGSAEFSVNITSNFDTFDTQITLDALKIHAYLYRKAAGKTAIADAVSRPER